MATKKLAPRDYIVVAYDEVGRLREHRIFAASYSVSLNGELGLYTEGEFHVAPYQMSAPLVQLFARGAWKSIRPAVPLPLNESLL